MDADDRPVGQVLTRRAAVGLLAAGGMAAAFWQRLDAQTSPSVAGCVVKPEMTEGPYFVDKQAMRSDIRSDPQSGVVMPGLPVALSFAVSRLGDGACQPLRDAVVDVWQCDALGQYSAVSDPRFEAATIKQSFLRGAQQTDELGAARFLTIYPGWYTGRAVHIHFKIRTQTPAGQAYEFTSQLYFPESLNDEVHATAPYNQKGRRDVLNERDGIYRNGGDQLLLQPTRTNDGFDAVLNIALDLSNENVGRSDSGGGRGRGGRGRGRG
jgi:protocatechuate 3,4-dioxygenase beta subunit